MNSPGTSAISISEKRRVALLGKKVRCEQRVQQGPFSTTTRVRDANTLANTTASDPHAGLVLDMRVSTVVYPI